MSASSQQLRPTLPIVLTGALIALLGLLAFLQYRWVGQVSIAERERLEESLQTSTEQLGEDLYRELARVGIGFRPGFPPADSDLSDQLNRSYEFWQTTAPYPGLVGDIYVAELEPEGVVTLERFDPNSGLLEETPLTEPLDELRSRVDELRGSQTPGVDLMWTLGPGGLEVEGIDESIWLLLPGGGAFGPPQPFAQGRGFGQLRWTLVSVDVDYLSTEVLPAIIGNHFDPDEYLVGVFRSDRLLYANGTDATTTDFADPDAQGDVVRPIPDRRGRGGGGRGGIGFNVAGAPWETRVKHQSGSLDAAVATARRRNLAVGFGILGLLGVSGALTIVWAERARSLGRMQMEFAASMSHELRTPLATIRTAAHNIAEGVVRDPEQVKEYAAMVQAEGRRLSSMVDQVIQFAQTESGRRHYNLDSVKVEHLVERALTTTFSNREEAGERVRTTIDSDLPDVRADETATTHALVNLLVNALKYGIAPGADPKSPIEIEASREPESGEICIHVRDHGPGIDSADLPHVFEPYYRGSNSGSIPGGGLGLSLVKKMMEGQGGSVSVTSQPGQGTTFTLHLPAAEGIL